MSMGTDTRTASTPGAEPSASTPVPGGRQTLASAATSPFGGGLAGARRAAAADEDARAREVAAQHSGEDAYAGMSPKERRAAQRAARRLKGTFEDYTHLLAMKPREGYAFHSDYFKVDGQFASVLGFFHDEASRDDFLPFWGISRIPAGMEKTGASVVVFEQVRRMGEKWVSDHISTSEKLDKLDTDEQGQTGTNSTRRKVQKVSEDLAQVTAEIQDGASYLHVHNRLLVKAPTLEALDEVIERIGRLYVDRFGTINVAAYPGEQRQELSALTRRNDKKRGKGQHFTSVEFAGSHALVTNGLNDPSGEYVGKMLGDVNNSAVLFDVNDYADHVVVADGTQNPHLNRSFVSDMWGSKISQSALLNNARVVHLILDGTNLDDLGPRLGALTARLDMNSGDINMLEMFGERADELSIFPAHLEKLVLMVEQTYESTDADRSIIRGKLKETLTEFYVDKGMWYRNAAENRARLRLVGLDHTHVPRIRDLVTYFDTNHAALAASSARDNEELHAYGVLRTVFRDLVENNGDLFDNHTNDEIDGVGEARRVVYDFSRLLHRSRGVAMAQLVNTVGFAVSNLGLGDTVIIHGTEHVDERIKRYITDQISRLRDRGGRVAYLYNDIDKMLADADFNKFEKADWTILGAMTPSTVGAYQKRMAQDIPPDLERLVTTRDRGLSYLRRGVTNVVFEFDLALGVNPARKAQREAAEAQARKVEEAKAEKAALAARRARSQRDSASISAATARPVLRPVRRTLPGPQSPARAR